MKTPLCALVLIVCLGGTVAHALHFIGPPSTTMQQGQWAIGARYANSEQDIERDDGTEVKDFELDSTLACITVGLASDRMELFGLVGAGEGEDAIDSIDADFVLGAGSRVTFNQGEELTWGLVAQFVWYDFEDRGQDVDIDLVDWQIAGGPCWRVKQFALYGGPMIHLVRGEQEWDDAASQDIEETSMFGAYIGGGYEFWERLSVMAEFQMTPDANGFGIAAQYTF